MVDAINDAREAWIGWLYDNLCNEDGDVDERARDVRAGREDSEMFIVGYVTAADNIEESCNG